MRLAAQLRIFTGVTAVIGSGGKTMLLRTLGEELGGLWPGAAVHHYQNISLPRPALRPDSGRTGPTAAEPPPYVRRKPCSGRREINSSICTAGNAYSMV